MSGLIDGRSFKPKLRWLGRWWLVYRLGRPGSVSILRTGNKLSPQSTMPRIQTGAAPLFHGRSYGDALSLAEAPFAGTAFEYAAMLGWRERSRGKPVCELELGQSVVSNLNEVVGVRRPQDLEHSRPATPGFPDLSAPACLRSGSQRGRLLEARGSDGTERWLARLRAE